ncbi:phospholipase D family protein [Variovorax ureilyticus]|uniref:phospholipase D n=2 Tax=Variovorax ureilyticus TaxID=1836198 RepID=A0ABU8VRU0_9BURK
MRSFLLPSSRRALLGITFALLAGCASSPGPLPSESKIEVAFSPDAGSEALVLKVIDKARSSIRLAGYSFTSPSIVRALIDAKRRGVDVRVLLDERGNRGKANIAAMNLLVGANIPTNVISTYAIHHDKNIVVDGKHTQTGSFNYSQAAAKSNSENVLVVWSNPTVAATYLAHWESRWAQGMAIEMSY